MGELRLSAILVPALCAVAGGAVGALVTVSLVKPARTDVHAEPLTTAEASPVPKSNADGRVAALERSVQALALRDAMQRATAHASAAGSADNPPIADVAPIIDNPVFEAAVRDVMDRAEQDRTLEREAERAEWRQRAADHWAGELTSKLRLTDVQKAKAVEVANGFWEKLRDLRPSDGGPPLTRQERRERTDALRKSAEGELAKVLDHGQMTSYQELDESLRLGTQRNLRGGQRGGQRPQ